MELYCYIQTIEDGSQVLYPQTRSFRNAVFCAYKGRRILLIFKMFIP
jgi:hypothetical protein